MECSLSSSAYDQISNLLVLSATICVNLRQNGFHPASCNSTRSVAGTLIFNFSPSARNRSCHARESASCLLEISGNWLCRIE
jgi:hypothetical protein